MKMDFLAIIGLLVFFIPTTVLAAGQPNPYPWVYSKNATIRPHALTEGNVTDSSPPSTRQNAQVPQFKHPENRQFFIKHSQAHNAYLNPHAFKHRGQHRSNQQKWQYNPRERQLRITRLQAKLMALEKRIHLYEKDALEIIQELATLYP